VNPLPRFHYRAIQHSRQLFVSHPNLRHGHPLEDPATTRSRVYLFLAQAL
jgi:hypothetical protein